MGEAERPKWGRAPVGSNGHLSRMCVALVAYSLVQDMKTGREQISGRGRHSVAGQVNATQKPVCTIESGLQTGNSGDEGELCPLVQGCPTTRMEPSLEGHGIIVSDPEDGELDRRTTWRTDSGA